MAIVDALGFRGIWRDHEPSDVVKVLRRAKRNVEGDAEYRTMLTDVEMKVAAFSDTLIFTAFSTAAETTPAERTRATVAAIASTVSFLMLTACAKPVPLAYRGCVSYGNVTVSDSFFIGEAIDDAAEWYEKADAGVVWLVPRVTRALELGEDFMLGLVPWEVPIKGVGHITTLVVNPFFEQVAIHGLNEAVLDVAERKLLSPFERSTRIDVVRKQQQTQVFMNAAREHTTEHYPAWLAVAGTASAQ